MPHSEFSEYSAIISKMFTGYGLSGQKGANYSNDKDTIRLPRQVSCTINRTLTNWGKVGHKVPETLTNTTVSTTKAHE